MKYAYILLTGHKLKAGTLKYSVFFSVFQVSEKGCKVTIIITKVLYICESVHIDW